MAMTKFNLVVNIEVAEGKGEDANLAEDFVQTFLMGVFDGLGGRSAGYGGKTGGRIASEEASQISKIFFKQRYGEIKPENVIQLQQQICRSLKIKADIEMRPKTSSRLKGSLVEHKLCTTIALASIPKQKGQERIFEANLAWMGDSRIYFLSPTKGLQQLTKDDLVTPKDALEMLRQDPPMSQYLTADINPTWQIHFQHYEIEGSGCFLACTDGCFQYVSAPWEFEKLLLDTLFQSEGDKIETNNWQKLIDLKYTEIKQDDVSLIIYPVGFHGVKYLKSAYQQRWQHLQANFISPNANTCYEDLQKLWETYRIDYEHYLSFIQDTKLAVTSQLPVSDNYYSSITSTTSSLSANKFQEISQTFRQKAEAKAEEIKKLLEQAKSCYQTNHLQEAKDLCNQVEKLIKNHPENPEKLLESLRDLGFIYSRLNQGEKAVHYYQQFFNSPGAENLDYWEEHLEAFVKFLHLISNKCEPANVAIQFCQRLITSILPDEKKAYLYYFMAVLQEIEGELNAAWNSIETAMNICSSSLEIKYESSVVKKVRQKYQEIQNLKYRGYY